ncbi:MAG TPA: invasion associated locus B family protein [Rhizomicrobium sp.]|jgi:invasion protein IalB|nr:invasion associated locus B family protein [Rhizomicrobium sp.]
MKGIVVGAVLAIVFLALMFAAPRLLPRGIEGMTRAEIAQLGTGFSGTKYIGSWTLVCSGAPARAGAAKSAAPSASQAAVGRCRMARGYRDRNGQLVLAVAFRYAGPAKELTMIVRFPPVGRQGEYLVLGLGSKTRIRLPVFGCTKGACIAVGALIPAAESLLLAAPQAEVVLPPNANGKQYTIGIRLDGLAPALDGMRRAEL